MPPPPPAAKKRALLFLSYVLDHNVNCSQYSKVTPQYYATDQGLIHMASFAHQEMVHAEGDEDGDFYEPDWAISKYIPGGYSPSRCLKLRGRAMMYAVLTLAGTAVLFFGTVFLFLSSLFF